MIKPALAIRSTVYIAIGVLIFFYLFRVIGFAPYGVDFSDEGRHLNEIKYASSYSWAASQYGSLIHPIAQFTNFNIPLLRFLNIIATFVLAILAFYGQFKKTWLRNLELKRNAIVGGFVFGLLGITFFNVWLPTPSYYSVTFQALLLYWISFRVFNVKPATKIPFVGVVFIAFSTFIVFLAKPSAFLVVWSISMLLFCKSIPYRKSYLVQYNLLLSLFLLLSSMIWFGSPVQIFHRVLLASQFMAIQDPAYKLENILRLDDFPYSWKLLVVLFLLSGLLAAIVTMFFQQSSRKRIQLIIGLFFSLLVLIYVFAVSYNFDSNPLILLIIPLFFSFNLLLMNSKICSVGQNFEKTNVLPLLFLPLAYALGTNGNLWTASSQAIFFLVLMSWLLLYRLKHEKLVQVSQRVILLIVLPLSVFTIEHGVSNPYRQAQSLVSQVSSAVTDTRLKDLRVSPGIESSLAKVYESTIEAGFEEGTPIIDLTGQSPLTLFALGAYPVGSPWMVGGYLGSNTLANAVLEKVDCEMLTDSWVLVEPDGPRSLNIEIVLESFGSKISNYTFQAEWTTPAGAGGYSKVRLQRLLKPIDLQKPTRIKSCILSR